MEGFTEQLTASTHQKNSSHAGSSHFYGFEHLFGTSKQKMNDRKVETASPSQNPKSIPKYLVIHYKNGGIGIIRGYQDNEQKCWIPLREKSVLGGLAPIEPRPRGVLMAGNFRGWRDLPRGWSWLVGKSIEPMIDFPIAMFQQAGGYHLVVKKSMLTEMVCKKTGVQSP